VYEIDKVDWIEMLRDLLAKPLAISTIYGFIHLSEKMFVIKKSINVACTIFF
jgi:hypothetical protein